MKLTIKQLAQNGTIFVPQTVAEAVVVKNGEQIITLDQVLDKKIEEIVTPVDSGLQTTRNGKSVIITHSNEITTNTEPQPLLIQHDSRGHIIYTKAAGKLIVQVNSKPLLAVDGSQDQELKFGSDFEIDEDKQIILKWTQL